MRVLVSHETDDVIGIELLGELNGIDVISYDPNVEELTDEQRAAEILIPPYRGTHRAKPLLQQLPKLRLVQLPSAGADEWIGIVPAEVALTTARGGHARPVAEWVLSAILALYRQWPALTRFADARTWAHRRVDADTLANKNVLILGAGRIGLAAAKLLAVFEASTTLVASAARDGFHGPAELPELIPQHDIVVITAPLTERTQGMVDRTFLAAMPDHALLVNAGRGQIVDTAALVDELENGRLRAALDVTDPEPLPAQHPLWGSPGVIISPHMARTVPGTNQLCYQVVVEQISAFAGGSVPSNLVTDRPD